MKCRGELCSGYSVDYFYPLCLETNLRTNINCECELLANIADVRDELIRKCRLFEEVFEIDISGFNEEVEKIEW